MKKLSPFIMRELEEIERIVEEEKKSDKRSDKKDRTVSQFEHSKAMMEMNKLRDTKKGKE
jgi:hypothetical protein